MVVNINGIGWHTVIDHLPNRFGECRFDTQEIVIDDCTHKDNLYRTVMHEVSHAYIFSYGFSFKEWKEEDVVEFISCNIQNIMEYTNKIYMYVGEKLYGKK